MGQGLVDHHPRVCFISLEALDLRGALSLMRSEEFLVRDEESGFTSSIGKILGSMISIIEKEISKLSESGLNKFIKQNLNYKLK